MGIKHFTKRRIHSFEKPRTASMADGSMSFVDVNHVNGKGNEWEHFESN